MLDTAGDGEPLLCINESQWAYGTKIHFVKQAGKGVGGGVGGGQQRVSSGRSEKIRTGVLHINNYSSEWCF